MENFKKENLSEYKFTLISDVSTKEASKSSNISLENGYRDWETDRKSTRLNSSHRSLSRMPSSA